jgi:DNA-binding transcriptional LysR family regulator
MLNLQHLSSFLALQQTGSFTAAAERLGLSQSTVSQHIQRLEDHLGRRLIWRNTHMARLTADGEALLAHARDMLDIDGKVMALFSGTRLRGRLRLGISEADLSGVLYEIQDRGELDLVLAKRLQNDARGRFLHREPLIWLGRNTALHLEAGEALPLIAYPPPSITRRIALDALERKGIAWRIVCTCNSLSGLTAAAAAGMGVLVQPRSMAPPGLVEIATPQLPPLDDVEFVLVPSRGANPEIAEALWREIQSRIAGSFRD